MMESAPAIPANWNKNTVKAALGKPVSKSKTSGHKAGVKEGGRHIALVSEAGRLRNHGLIGEPLLQALHEINKTFDPPLPIEEVDRIATDADNWDGGEGFLRSENGKVLINSRANIERAINGLGIDIRYNSFTRETFIDNNRLDDVSVRRTWFHIEDRYAFRPSKNIFEDVVYDIGERKSFNPVRERFDQLEGSWDRIRRLDTWLIDYADVEDTELNRAIGRILLIAIIRRVRQPGCKFDTMPVLIGKQGCGKSTLARYLALKDEWFSDRVPFTDSPREVIESLDGHLVLEAGELAGLGRASSEQLKSFLSRQWDKGRAAYKRTTDKVPRSCVFVGTTNNETFLNDSTGARRFLPVEVGEIDLSGFLRDRDQLYAEAAVCETKGEAITLPPELWAAASEATDKRRVENPITAKLAEKLGSFTGRIRSTDVWKLLEIPTAQQNSMSRIVSASMAELGWKHSKYRFDDGSSLRGYQRGDGSELIACGNTVLAKSTSSTPDS